MYLPYQPIRSTPFIPALGVHQGRCTVYLFQAGEQETIKLIHADVCGPMHVTNPSGARFFVLFTDDFSGWRHVYFLKQKSEVSEFFKDYVNLLRSETCNLVYTLRSRPSLACTLARRTVGKNLLRFIGTTHPEQNSIAERTNRTIVEAGRSLLHAKHLAIELWGEAIAFTVYTLNRVSNSISSTTHHQMWNGLIPNVSHLRIFGSIAFFHIPKVDRRKLDSKSLKFFCWVCTYSEDLPFWDPVGRKIKISRDVLFDEQLNDDPVFPIEFKDTNPFKFFFRQSLSSSTVSKFFSCRNR